MKKRLPIDILALFNRKTKKSSGCWIWGGWKPGQHYPYASLGTDGNRMTAHRLAYRLFKGEIPEEYFVCHSCDSKGCVNPSHLFLGTAKDNLRDAMDKGRFFNCGEANPGAKLSLDDVLKIKAAIANGKSQEALALEFGVSQTNISYIVLGKTWSKAIDLANQRLVEGPLPVLQGGRLLLGGKPGAKVARA